LYVWDMRQDRPPVTLLKAHTSDIWSIQFHPVYPSHLFSCSNDGSLWQWDYLTPDNSTASLLTGRTGGHVMDVAMETGSDWTTASDRQISVKSLLTRSVGSSGDLLSSVNCLDTCANRLVCGTDSEQLVYIDKLNVY